MTFVIDTGKFKPALPAAARQSPEGVVAPEARSFGSAERAQPTGNFSPMRDRYRALSEVERDALVAELALALSTCGFETRQRMIDSFHAIDPDYGRRVSEALANAR